MEEKANDPQPHTSWRYVPSLFLVYLAGIAAVGNKNWSYLAAALLSNPIRHLYRPHITEYTFETIAENLIYRYQEDQAPNNSTAGYPIGKPMQEALEPLFTRFLPSENEFNEAFDIFEFMLALHHFHARMDTELSKPMLPRYGDHRQYQKRSIDPIMSFLEKGGKLGDSWEPLKVGLFDGSSQRLVTVLEAYQEKLAKVNSVYDFAFGSPNYLEVYHSGLA